MAGICTGPGLTTDDGLLIAAGPVSAVWPGPDACTLEVNNGLRVDPVSGKLWVPPDQIIADAEDTAAGGVIVPTDASTIVLTDLSVQQLARICTPSFWACWITGGFAGFRLGSGNFWQVQRVITTYVNGVPVGTTGTEIVGVTENNSGGVLSSGGACDGLMLHGTLAEGDLVRVVAHYELNPLTYTADAANGLAWRPPKLSSVLWSRP